MVCCSVGGQPWRLTVAGQLVLGWPVSWEEAVGWTLSWLTAGQGRGHTLLWSLSQLRVLEASDAPVSCWTGYQSHHTVTMGKDLVDLTFFKDSDEPWGFRLAGGKDFGQPLSISQVRRFTSLSSIENSKLSFLILSNSDILDVRPC